MFGAVEPGRSRYLRLRPADWFDLVLLIVMAAGLGLWFAGAGAAPAAPWDWMQPVLHALFASHGSTPILFFLGALLYLNRWGRCLGAHRWWLVVAVAMTVPLWFLAGMSLTVRGLGDITLFLVPWNILAMVLMGVGVRRSMSGGRRRAKKPA